MREVLLAYVVFVGSGYMNTRWTPTQTEQRPFSEKITDSASENLNRQRGVAHLTFG